MIVLQHTSVSPDGRLLAVVGDNLHGLLVDAHNGKVHVISHCCDSSMHLLLFTWLEEISDEINISKLIFYRVDVLKYSIILLIIRRGKKT